MWGFNSQTVSFLVRSKIPSKIHFNSYHRYFLVSCIWIFSVYLIFQEIYRCNKHITFATKMSLCYQGVYAMCDNYAWIIYIPASCSKWNISSRIYNVSWEFIMSPGAPKIDFSANDCNGYRVIAIGELGWVRTINHGKISYLKV